MHSGGMLAGWKFSNFKDGVFAEYFHVNDADGNMAILPESIDDVSGVMLCDMIPTGFHGVELADVQFGDKVLVIGIGPVGLMPGGRLRMEKLISLIETKRICPSRLVTHQFHGFDKVEEALLMMKDKPKDLIKPIVFID